MRPTGAWQSRKVLLCASGLFPFPYCDVDRNAHSRKSCPFDQTAAHNCCRKFARQAAVKTSELPDGYKFQGAELERTALYQFLELPYSHLVQAPGHLAESRSPIRLKGGSAPDKNLLTEHYM